MTNPKYDLTYVFYDHEEVTADKNGLRKVVESHPDWIQGDFAVIGEPTDCIEAVQWTIRFDVITHGVAAPARAGWDRTPSTPDLMRSTHTSRRTTVDGLVS